MAEILVNGETVEVEEGALLIDVLRNMGEPYTVGLVELNSRLVKRSEMESVTLSDGDKVEVILPAFGG